MAGTKAVAGELRMPIEEVGAIGFGAGVQGCRVEGASDHCRVFQGN